MSILLKVKLHKEDDDSVELWSDRKLWAVSHVDMFWEGYDDGGIILKRLRNAEEITFELKEVPNAVQK